MALSARLQLRQSQTLAMTPQLMQSIRLLQLSHAELERFIEEEMERNPLLERPELLDEEGREDHSGDQEHDREHDQGREGPDRQHSDETSVSGLDRLFTEEGVSAQTMADRLDSSMENLFPDDPGRAEPGSSDLAAPRRSDFVDGGKGVDIDMLAASGTSLAAHVGEQIAFAFRSEVEQLIARELAAALDEAGYLHAEPAEVATRLGVDEAQVHNVLSACQRFDPAGLFARDLAECLALQLAARNRLDPAMSAMVAHLDLVARRDFARLRDLCGVRDDDLLDMMAEIRRLDPRPGDAFTGGVAATIVPDVIVRQASDGSWLVELNADALPRVLVNDSYSTQITKYARSKSDRDFLADCIQQANWLTRSLDQRARTILKVASEIVRQQDEFLLHGVRHLRPLALKDVAQAIEMHESTVSRVTTGKYMMTPRGVFELRWFFSVAIAAVAGGEAHSAAAVRDLICELIEREEPHNVLSDDAIVDMLCERGIDIARRTVAKYREAMAIPSSVQRRREKRVRAAVRN